MLNTKEKIKKNKKGISLIVLVITIIVIVILVVAVILTISNNNPIKNANKARFQNDIKILQEQLNIYSSKNLIDNNVYLFNANSSTEENGVNVYECIFGDIISNYKEKIDIINSKIYLKNNSFSEDKLKWALEINVKSTDDLKNEYISDGLVMNLDGYIYPEEGDKTYWKDISGNGNDAYLQGDAKYNEEDKSYSTNGGVIVVKRPKFNSLEDITMEILIRFDEVKNKNRNRYLSANNGSTNAGLYPNAIYNNQLLNIWYTNTSIYSTYSIGISGIGRKLEENIDSTKFYHLSGSPYLGSEIEHKNGLYVDNEREDLDYYSGEKKEFLGDGYMRFNYHAYNNNSTIKMFRLYNRRLSEYELTYNYNIDKYRYNI